MVAGLELDPGEVLVVPPRARLVVGQHALSVDEQCHAIVDPDEERMVAAHFEVQHPRGVGDAIPCAGVERGRKVHGPLGGSDELPV